MSLMRAFTLYWVVALGMLTGCDDFPKDMAGTMEGVLSSGTMRAGIVAGGPEDEQRALIARLASSLNVEASIFTGSTEDLVHRMNNGEIDILVGEFSANTPWKSQVGMTGPVRAINPPADKPVLRAIVRSGENRWLMKVAKIVRKNMQ